MIKRILKRLSGWKESILKDKLTFRDTLSITMRREDGSIYKQWEEKANTWVTAGKTLIRDALATGGFTLIGYMSQNGTGGAATMATTNSTPAADKARFIATWVAAGAITDITSFGIRQSAGGSDLATIACTSFSKPDGISIEITWDTTIA